MIKPINKDINLLKQKSTDLTINELYVVTDLMDTLKFHKDMCIGMAANMIGYLKNAIVVLLENGKIMPLINPKILQKEGMYLSEEGCLSLEGTRNAIRYKHIKVEYLDINFKKKIKDFKDLEAQVIEHEIDHTLGIII